MKKKLEQGTTLVVDRYAFSGVAFTSAKPVSLSSASFRLCCVFVRGATDALTCSISSRVSVWTGASSLMWDCRSRTSSCFYISSQIRLLSEVNSEMSDMRPVFSKKRFIRSLTSCWRILQSTGRYEAALDCKFISSYPFPVVISTCDLNHLF